MQENNFGSKIATLRKSKNLTQAYIAEKLGVTPAAVSKWENGSSKPRVEVLFKLAELLEVNAKELVSQDKETVSAKPEKHKTTYDKAVIIFFAVVAFVLAVSVIFLVVFTNCVTVPDVTGMDCSKAEQMLEKLGLEYQAVGEYHIKTPQNVIISQDIQAGTTVRKNSTITVTVSKGRQTVSMPQVIYCPVDYGVEMLEGLGMEVLIRNVYDARYENDLIIFQSVQIGDSVYTGTAITIYVNKLS